METRLAKYVTLSNHFPVLPDLWDPYSVSLSVIYKEYTERLLLKFFFLTISKKAVGAQLGRCYL
jgi:hypothetical protein